MSDSQKSQRWVDQGSRGRSRDARFSSVTEFLTNPIQACLMAHIWSRRFGRSYLVPHRQSIESHGPTTVRNGSVERPSFDCDFSKHGGWIRLDDSDSNRSGCTPSHASDLQSVETGTSRTCIQVQHTSYREPARAFDCGSSRKNRIYRKF